MYSSHELVSFEGMHEKSWQTIVQILTKDYTDQLVLQPVKNANQQILKQHVEYS
jgi:hypothetical protein